MKIRLIPAGRDPFWVCMSGACCIAVMFMPWWGVPLMLWAGTEYWQMSDLL